MTGPRIVMVGNGRMAQRCAAILLDHDDSCLRLMVAEDRPEPAQSRLAGFCRKHKIEWLSSTPALSAPSVVRRIAAAEPDFIFSVDNLQIFGDDLLAIPKRGCINFHNGPIERYRGLHIPSWALFNGESTHSVTWHYMEHSVDTGAIAAEQSFALGDGETALSLTLKCIDAGIELFAARLPDLLGGRKRLASTSDAKLYKHGQVPNGGILDLRWPSAQVDRMLRALDFRPFPNPLGYARLRFSRGDLIVNAARALGANTAHPAGRIIAAGDELVLACADRELLLTAVMLEPGVEASAAEAIAKLELEVGLEVIRDS